MRTMMLVAAAAITGASAVPVAAESPSAIPMAAGHIGQYAMLLDDDDDDRGYRGRYWRGDDGRYRCRRDDGTVGLLVGGGVGALLGREIDGGRNRATGTIIGGVVGALVGREIDRSDVECR